MTALGAEGSSLRGAMLLQAAGDLQETLAGGSPWGVTVLPAVSWVLDGMGAVLDGTAGQPDCPAQAREPLSRAGADITAAARCAGVSWGACGEPSAGRATPAGAEVAAWRAAAAAQALHHEPPAAALPAAAGALGTLGGCLEIITAALPAGSVARAQLGEAAGRLRTAATLTGAAGAVFSGRRPGAATAGLPDLSDSPRLRQGASVTPGEATGSAGRNEPVRPVPQPGDKFIHTLYIRRGTPQAYINASPGDERHYQVREVTQVDSDGTVHHKEAGTSGRRGAFRVEGTFSVSQQSAEVRRWLAPEEGMPQAPGNSAGPDPVPPAPLLDFPDNLASGVLARPAGPRRTAGPPGGPAPRRTL